MKTLYALALALALALFLPVGSAFADNLIMPKELAELATEAGCAPVNDFFMIRPGHVDPLYLYGYAPGTGVLAGENKAKAAAFWCIDKHKGHPEPLLVFARKTHPWHGFSLADSAKQLPCPNVIRGHGNPAGLSVQPPNRPLDRFNKLDTPKQPQPPLPT